MTRKMTAVLSLLLMCALFCTIVQADFGPKDRLVVYVENPPDELYYLDLLYESDPEDVVYANCSEEELDALNGDMLERIRSNIYHMTAALADGTQVPVFGKLTGEADGMRMKHTFSYYGVPDTYRIIVVTESGSVRVSEEYTRKAMQSSIVYDFESGMCRVPPLWKQYALQFLCTFGMTLLIEGIVFVLFGFREKRDWLVFLGVNLVTQLAMTAFVGRMLILRGTVSAMMGLQVCEICILLIESGAYAFLLRGATRRRRCWYGVAANLASWLISALSLNVVYSMIVSVA